MLLQRTPGWGCRRLPSAFSIIFGVLPSRIATAELVVPISLLVGQSYQWSEECLNVPRSMPITWPLTFSSPPVDWYRANDDARGERVKEEREKEDAVRGSYRLI